MEIVKYYYNFPFVGGAGVAGVARVVIWTEMDEDTSW